MSWFGEEVEVGRLVVVIVVGGGGRASNEAVRRFWSLVMSERICFGMRHVKGTTEEKRMTTNCISRKLVKIDQVLYFYFFFFG